jgi:hypothetical protein
VGFILLIFIIVVLLALEKGSFANNLKLSLDARSVAGSLIANVNTISEQSFGYYRYVSFPTRLFGGVDYNLSSAGNVISIEYEGGEWVDESLASNVTIFCLDKGENLLNRIENTGDAVIVTCHRPNLAFKRNSFKASSSKAGENATLSITVEDRSHVAAPAFTVRFNNSVNYTVPSLPAGEEVQVSYAITVPATGTHTLAFEIDPGNSVNESIEEDNTLNVSWQTT